MDAKESRWSLSHAENRAGCAILVGLLSWFAFHKGGVPILVGVVTYLVLTAIVGNRRRTDQPTDDQP